ncbi:MAG: hypothetical protein WBG86_23195 [Polyangiales bacterium]
MGGKKLELGALAISLAFTVVACSNGGGSDDPRTGTGGSGAGAAGEAGNAGVGGMGASPGAGGSSATGGTTGECAQVLCPDGNSYGCGDCLDNDDDGLADDKDPECLGPCDDTEGPVLLTGTPGETGNQCGADCYFDRGNGAGSGECKWNRECDPLDPKDGCSFPPPPNVDANVCQAEQPDGCEESCGALTPNGCDCFGCCTFPELDDGYVFLGSFMGNEGTCTLDDLNDPALCRPCTPAGNCLNTCERCEICLGKPTIPADCLPGTGGSGGTSGTGGTDGGERCPVGKQACGLPGDPACPAGSFCLTGCCTEIVVQ